MAVLTQMVIFFIFMGVGIYAKKIGAIAKANEAQLSALVVRVAYPAIILSGVSGEGDRLPAGSLQLAVCAMAALMVLLFAFSYLIARVLGYGARTRGAIVVMSVFSSIGFIGVPMIDALYGKSALIYMSVFLIPFNLLFYSYGIGAVKGGDEKFSLKSVLNEGMIACFLAVGIYLADVRLPYAIAASLQMLGSMTAPLAMMLLGAFLRDVDFRRILKNGRIFVYTALKMIVMPLAIIFILKPFVADPLLLAVCAAVLATPSGNVVALLTAQFNEAAHEDTVAGVALTTVVSVATLPLVFWIAGI